MMRIDTDEALVQQIVDLTTSHKLTALELSCFFAEKPSVARTQREVVALLDELVERGTLRSVGDGQAALYRPNHLTPGQELAWDAIDREASARWIDENTTLNSFYQGRLYYLNFTKRSRLLDQDCFNHVLVPTDDPCELVIDGKRYIHFSRNDYLGLARHPAVLEAARAALDTYGLGASGSRLACGTQPPHRELEETIARFKGTEDAIVLNTGYTMNLVLANLVDENCVIFSDDLNHASIIDGTHVSRARVVRFAHNDVADLDAKLSQTPASMRKYVLIEGVYSMDGDIARLDEILAVARRHRALVAVDEAHSAGTLGAGGRGVFEYFGIDPGPMVLKAGTLGKAFGACGGYIAGSHLVIDMLRCTARPFMFSTSLPSAVLAGAKAAFEVLEQHPELVERVQANGRYVRGRLQELGFDTHPSETQIIPILIRDEQKLGQLHRDLKEAGIWVMAVEHPGVPRGQGRLRLSLSAEHTREQLDRLLEVLAVRGKARGII